MPKEYRTIQEVAGPLMLVQGVENVTYDELGEIELANGEKRRCKVLEVDGNTALPQGRAAASCRANSAQPFCPSGWSGARYQARRGCCSRVHCAESVKS